MNNAGKQILCETQCWLIVARSVCFSELASFTVSCLSWRNYSSEESTWGKSENEITSPQRSAAHSAIYSPRYIGLVARPALTAAAYSAPVLRSSKDTFPQCSCTS